MGSSLSTVTSYRQISTRSNHSSSSFNSTVTLPISQQPVSLPPAPAEPARLLNTSTTGCATAQNQIQSVDPPTITSENATEIHSDSVHPPTSNGEDATSAMETHMVNPHSMDDPRQNESKHIAELALPVSVAALAITLLVNVPESVKRKLLIPYNAYLVSLCVSLFTSIGLSMYSLVKSTLSPDLVWFQNRVMIISTGSVLISVILRLFLVLSATNLGYDVLSFLAIIGGIILYLWYCWRKVSN